MDVLTNVCFAWEHYIIQDAWEAEENKKVNMTQKEGVVVIHW